MALADLIARLEAEAARRAETIRHDADAEVRSIEDATAAAVSDARAAYLEGEHAQRQTKYARELAAVRQRARARELDARRAQLARVLQRARALVDEVAASPAYAEALPAHTDEALSFVEGLRPHVRCRSIFAAIVQPAVARHPGAELVLDEAMGPGVIADARDGAVVVDNTLAARLSRAEPYLVIELARRLEERDE